MKFAAPLTAMILISASLFGADARTERWQIRADELKKNIKIQASSPKLVSLIKKEEQKARDFISVLKRHSSGDGSLKSPEKKYPIDEIEKRTSDLSRPFISLFIFSGISGALNSRTEMNRLAEDLNREVKKLSGRSLKSGNSRAADIALEYRLERALKTVKSESKRHADEILRRVELELSKKDYRTNRIELDDLIMEKTFQTLSEKGKKGSAGIDNECLRATPQWKFMNRSLSRQDIMMKGALDFAKSEGISVPEKTAARGLAGTESHIFKQVKNEIVPLIENTLSADNRSGSTPLYEIPDFEKLKDALHETDRYRKNLIKNMDGTEGAAFIAKVKSNMETITSRPIRHYEKIFAGERARMGRIKKMNKIIIYNEEIFNTAEKHFSDLKTRVADYGKISAEFIEQICLAGKIKPREFLELYRYRHDRYTEYLSLFERLTAEAGPAGDSGSEKAHGIYRASVKGSVKITRSLMKPLPVPHDVRGAMTAADLKECRKTADRFRKNTSALAKAVRKNYNAYAAEYRAAMKKQQKAARESEALIVQEELDILFSYAESCAETRKSMNYTEGALKRYGRSFKKINEEASSGKFSPRIRAGLHRGSLIPLVDSFDPEKIDSEMKDRKFLAKQGMDSLSGALALYRHYMRRGIRAKIIPRTETIKEIKKMLLENPSEAVSSWTMTGQNYKTIDMNAAAELNRIITKKAWQSSVKSGKNIETIGAGKEGLNISVAMPAGWEQGSIKSPSPEASLYRSYLSPDRSGQISIAAFRTEEKNLRAFTGQWLRETGFSMVQKKWGADDKGRYLWTFSSGSYSRVMECYVLRSGEYIIIVSGLCSRSRHKMLRENIEDIFTSLKI